MEGTQTEQVSSSQRDGADLEGGSEGTGTSGAGEGDSLSAGGAVSEESLQDEASQALGLAELYQENFSVGIALPNYVFTSAEDTEGEAVRREDMARLYSAMEALSPSQRELVEKVYFEGRKITDIAREEGVTKQSVHERVERALKKLKKNFD